MVEVIPALPPKYDAILHHWGDRFQAYELCKPTPDAEKTRRKLRFGFSGKYLRNGELFLYTNFLGGDGSGVQPDCFEWEEIPNTAMRGGRWKMDKLRALQPKIEQAAREFEEREKVLAEQSQEPEVTEDTTDADAWDFEYKYNEYSYRMMLAYMAGIKNPKSLPEPILEALEIGAKVPAIKKDTFIRIKMDGRERPEPKAAPKLQDVDPKLLNDFWGYMQAPMQAVLTRKAS